MTNKRTKDRLVTTNTKRSITVPKTIKLKSLKTRKEGGVNSWKGSKKPRGGYNRVSPTNQKEATGDITQYLLIIKTETKIRKKIGPAVFLLWWTSRQ